MSEQNGQGLRPRLEQRLAELEAERRRGQQMVAELEVKQAELHQTLLRIAGAIQVLEELLAAEPSAEEGASPEAALPTGDVRAEADV